VRGQRWVKVVAVLMALLLLVPLVLETVSFFAN
jgi:hypothetical protein